MQFLNGQPENQAWTALDILSYILTRQTNRDTLPSFTQIYLLSDWYAFIVNLDKKKYINSDEDLFSVKMKSTKLF